MRRALGAFSLGLVGMLGIAGACFSDRDATGPPTSGAVACSIPLSSPIFGSTGTLVAIRSFSFQPDTIRVRPGTVVTWINCEPPTVDAHTTTSTDEVWESPFLAPGESYTRAFPTAGTFDYFCVPHPFMRAVVIVE